MYLMGDGREGETSSLQCMAIVIQWPALTFDNLTGCSEVKCGLTSVDAGCYAAQPQAGEESGWDDDT